MLISFCIKILLDTLGPIPVYTPSCAQRSKMGAWVMGETLFPRKTGSNSLGGQVRIGIFQRDP